jgi:tight adherence protein B
MAMNLYLAGIILFVMAISIIELLTYAFRQIRSPQRAKIRTRLRKYTFAENNSDSANLMRTRLLSEIPFINRWLKRMPFVRLMDTLVIQANAPYTVGFYFLLTALCTALALLLGIVMLKQNLSAALMALVSGAMPYFYLRMKKKARIEKFRSQMPEGLDLIARALKAGHALPSGMKLAAEQFEDPLGPELADTLYEINFGVSVADALKNLAMRIHCQEIRYFVVAVIMQRETGGNLAELMENLAHLIRANYKFQGKVRTLSAEGRLSAVVLIALPFLIAGWINYSTPQFIEPLLNEPVGRMMLTLAAVMMTLGIIVIRKMVKIDV